MHFLTHLFYSLSPTLQSSNPPTSHPTLIHPFDTFLSLPSIGYIPFFTILSVLPFWHFLLLRMSSFWHSFLIGNHPPTAPSSNRLFQLQTKTTWWWPTTTPWTTSRTSHIISSLDAWRYTHPTLSIQPHPINTTTHYQYNHTLSIQQHPINTPYQYTLHHLAHHFFSRCLEVHTHRPINTTTPYQYNHTLSIQQHPITTPYTTSHITSSPDAWRYTHRPINTPYTYQYNHTLSIQP